MNRIEDLLDSENNDLTLTEQSALSELFNALSYRVYYQDGLGFLKIGNMQIPLWKIQNYYYLPTPQEPEKEPYLTEEQQHTRYEGGYWLEWNTQRALSIAKIDFQGNPMNIKHYPHSKGLHVDADSPNMLIECFNPKRTTHMNKHDMHEKIDYFHAADPEHKKLWVMVASYKTWDKEITERQKQEQITVLLLNQRMHKRNIKRHYYSDIAQILSELNAMSKHFTNQLTNTIDKINQHLINKQYKHVYQIIDYSVATSVSGCGVHIFPNNLSDG